MYHGHGAVVVACLPSDPMEAGLIQTEDAFSYIKLFLLCIRTSVAAGLTNLKCFLFV